jgi:predicted RND superfamily exporter protein
MRTNDEYRARRPTFAQRYPWQIIILGLAIGVVAVVLATRLKLRTSFAELLPSKDPAVQALKRTEGRVGDLNLLTVGIRSPDRAANLQYAKLLTEALRTLPKSRVGLVAYNILDLQQFFHEHRWLYASEADLETARDRLRSEIVRRKNPMFVSLDDDNEGSDDKELRSKLEHNPLAQRFPDGYFVNGDVAWVLILPTGGLFDENAGEGLIGSVNAFVAAHPPSAFNRVMRVDSLGPVVVGLENRHAIEQDIKGVTIFCTVIIALSIISYFRGLSAIVLVVFPALWGTAIAFACGDLVFGYLNSSTAFLGSIILGNGINHAIILLSRYRENRARAEHGDPAGDGGGEDALPAAIATTARPTLTAALAASASYLALGTTSFRGFSQFGVMAAVGSLACWLATYTLLPAWLTVWAGARHRAATAVPLSLKPVAALIAARPRTLLFLSAALTPRCSAFSTSRARRSSTTSASCAPTSRVIPCASRWTTT